MAREAYDKVNKYRKVHGGTLGAAIKASGVTPSTYYNQKKSLASGGKRGKTRKKAITHELEVLPALPVESSARFDNLGPGLVAFVASPRDIAAMLHALIGGRQ